MKSPSPTTPRPIRLLQERHQENLEYMLENLLQDETLSDITIHCNDGSVKAHKLILAAFSPYFKKVKNVFFLEKWTDISVVRRWGNFQENHSLQAYYTPSQAVIILE